MEYGLIVLLIFLAIIGSVTLFSSNGLNLYKRVVDAVTGK